MLAARSPERSEGTSKLIPKFHEVFEIFGPSFLVNMFVFTAPKAEGSSFSGAVFWRRGESLLSRTQSRRQVASSPYRKKSAARKPTNPNMAF